MDERGTGIADVKYHELVKKAGLFGKAFYGERKTRQESRKLAYLWKVAMKYAEEQIAKSDRRTELLAAREARRLHRTRQDQGSSEGSDPSSQDQEGSA